MQVNQIVFANTLWFILNFKSSLVERLSANGTLTCIYLRDGPVIDSGKLNKLKMSGVYFKKLTPILAIKLFAKSCIVSANTSLHEKLSITVFTIGPIIISSILFMPQIRNIVVVLEGLGRLFSSRRIRSRIVKRIIESYYAIYFRKVKSVVVLNAMDAVFLASRKISPYYKIKLAPGTGLDIKALEEFTDNNTINPKYIDYIGRFLPEKGVYSFIYSKSLFDGMSFNSNDLQYRLILPKDDLAKLDPSMQIYLEKAGIVVRPYSPNPLKYYKDSALIIHPTEYAEGMSRVVMESAFLGIPLITTRSKGIEELLVENYEFFLSSTSPYRIAAMAYKALQSTSYFESIKNFHRKQIRTLYSQKSSDDFFEKVICSED